MMARLRISAIALTGLLAACASTSNSPSQAPYVAGRPTPIDAPIATQKIGRPYQVFGRWYTPARQDDYDAVGLASWYGDEFHGRPTANGERFDKDQLTAAHPTLPIPSYIQVTNLDNGRVAVLRVNDRGPFKSNRILDVSRRAAAELGFLNRGTANVRVSYLGPKEAELGTPRLYTSYVNGVPGDPVPVPPAYMVAAEPETRSPAYAVSGEPLAGSPAAASSTAIEVEPITRLEPVQIASIEPIAPVASVQETSAPVLYTPAPASGGWFIQAGAFSQAQRAESVRNQLEIYGPATIEPVEVGGQTLHRVLVGPYPAELAAKAARYQVAGAGFSDARLFER